MTLKELELKQREKSNSSEALFHDVEVGEKETGYYLDDTLDMIGFGKTQIEILFVFGFLLMTVVNETMGMSIISIASQCDFNTNSQEKALMGTACVTGILLASYLMGYLSDTYGRRTVLLRSTITALIFSTISMFVSNLWLFIVLRFFTGLGVAGASATIYAYLGEFNTPKYRAMMINYASVFVGISTMYTPDPVEKMPPNGFDVRLHHTNQNTFDVETNKQVVKEYSLEDALNKIGFGIVQLEILVFSGVLLMFVINETMGMSMITIASQCDFNINSQEKAIMSAACFFGILMASFPWGYLSDSSGRRSVLFRATLAAVLFSLMSIFVSNFWLFVVLRFLTGVGIAGASATTYAYLGEFITLKYRAVVINYASIFVGISTVYTPGFGKVHFEVLLASAIVVLDIINETIASSIVVLASQCDFDSSPVERSLMNTAVFIGLILASYPWGHLADIFGRRTVLLWTTIGSTGFSFLSMFSWNVWVYVLFRFLTGLAIAGSTSTLYPYLGEFNAMKYRPAVINYVTIPLGVSLIISAVVAWLILPQTWSFSMFGIFEFRPWRLLILCNLLPGLIGSIWIWALPETPKLYLSHGKDAEALKVLYWIYEKNTGKPSKDFQVKRLIPESDEEFIQTIQTKKTAWEIATSMWKQTVPLFKPPHALNYCLCCFIMFGLFFSSSGMGLWYPEIQNRLGFGTVSSHKTICGVINTKLNETINDTLETVCNDKISSKTYIDSITLGGSYVVAYLLLGIIINPLGRKAVLAGALGISGACGLALQWVDEPTAIVILFCGYLMLSGLCVSVMSGSVVDLIPTHLRGKAVCICLMIGRLGSVVGNNIIGAALETHCEITFYIFSGLIIFCSLLTLVLPI